jgi:hypothetical protein
MQPTCSSLTVGRRVCLHGYRSSCIGRYVRSLTGGFNLVVSLTSNFMGGFVGSLIGRLTVLVAVLWLV